MVMVVSLITSPVFMPEIWNWFCPPVSVHVSYSRFRDMERFIVFEYLTWNYSLFVSRLQSAISCISIQFARWQHDCGRSLLSTIALFFIIVGHCLNWNCIAAWLMLTSVISILEYCCNFFHKSAVSSQSYYLSIGVLNSFTLPLTEMQDIMINEDHP